MNPDQVADVRVQHQHDDDIGGSATSADGCCDGGGSGDSWARAVLRRGWDLSRKAAIFGVAATAAPVVAPPLLVLSLAGVALSLPFAAYLVSLAATDRLMAALLPSPRTQPYDLEDDGFLDASGAPSDEAPPFDHWCDTENDAIMEVEDDESFVSLPLSREPRFCEAEPVPSSTDDVEDKMVEAGEFLSRDRELGDESLVLDNREQDDEGATMEEEDIGYITMEAPPRGTDVFGSAVPVLRDEDNMVQRVVAEAKESVQELSVSDNGDRTEDGKCKDMEEMESFKEMVVKEVTINTDPFTGEVAGEQVGSIATALPESEWLQASNLVAQELQAMAEVANVDDVINDALTEDGVLDIGGTNTEGMEHYGAGGVYSVDSVVTVDDVAELVSSRSPAVSGISDGMTSVKSRPDDDRSNQTTGYTPRNKEFLEEEATEDKHVKTDENRTMDNKVPTRSMSPQITDVSKTPVPDDKSKIEDEVTVEMVLLEGVTNDADDLVTQEVVAVQLNIIASESESPSVSGHVAQELQADSARDSASSVEGTPVFDNPHQTTGVEYKALNEGFRRDVVAEDMDNYTEEQLREQLDTLTTITGYRPAPSLTLEAELVGLYVFVGLEAPVSSRDASDLNDLNTKLRFLKSIIGVE